MGIGGQRHAPAALPPSRRPGTHYTGAYVCPRGTKNFVPTGIHPKEDHHQIEIPAIGTNLACEGQ